MITTVIFKENLIDILKIRPLTLSYTLHRSWQAVNTIQKLKISHIISKKCSIYLNQVNYKLKYLFIFSNDFRLQSPVYFRHGSEIPPHVQAITLNCHDATNVSHVLQTDGYALVQYKPLPGAGAAREPGATEEETEEPRKPVLRKPSVIMFGLDTMSRINLRRTMPRVSKFLTQTGWYEMQGYNKVRLHYTLTLSIQSMILMSGSG